MNPEDESSAAALWPGEEEGWEILAAREPGSVCAGADARFDPLEMAYALTCFGQQIRVSPGDRLFSGDSRPGRHLLAALGPFSRLSILRYLIHATDRPPTDRLVRPSDLPGGDIFARGTHVLPLDRAAARFSNRAQEFFTAGRLLGGRKLDYGDMSLRLFPFPRVSAVLIVWSGDDEFPATASLLLEPGGVACLPPDIVWSVCMLTVEMMLIDTGAENR